MTDHYITLGVDKNATQDEIKKSYRKLASQHHPDKGGNTAKFQEIQTAYDILSDPEKRQQYDNPRPQFNFNQGGIPPGFEDIFSSVFGGNSFFDNINRSRSQARNRTLSLQTQISLEEAFSGKEMMVNIKLPSGRDQTLEIKIPPGIRSDTTLRLSGVGDDSVPNAPRGDIHLVVSIIPHPIFKREQDDLIMKLDISCFDAILGKTVQFETINGTLLETIIPPGIQQGQMLNVQGHGMPSVANYHMRGRLLIALNITIPITLTNDQKAALRKIIQ